MALLCGLPGVAAADQAACEAHARSHGLTSEYFTQSVAECSARADKMRAALSANPILALQETGALCAYSSLMATTMQDPTYRDDAGQSSALLDELAPAAVKASHSSADLTKAVKEYYAAASAHCADGTRSTEPEYQLKANALRLELKLAGIK